MVYCGKPSRGCQMCRTRRIKCDETKPTCLQCQKSRRQCPGYKDDFDIVFRNETKATERRARRALQKLHSPNTQKNHQFTFSRAADDRANSDGSSSLIKPTSDAWSNSPTLKQLTVSIEDQAPCFFISNFVRLPRATGSRGTFEFVVPIIKTESPNSHLSIAFSAVALASMANRPSTRSSSLLIQAISQYSKALKAINAALQNPAQQKSDATLASVLLLGFFENIISERTNILAWGSHIQGAVQLVILRGKKQLRTKIGQALFANVRSQMVLHCLSSSKAPFISAEWWTSDGTPSDDPSLFVTTICLRTAQLRAEVNNTLPASPRSPKYFQMVLDLIKRAQNMDKECKAWEESLPDYWRPRTAAWVDHVPGGNLLKADVFPGRVDIYEDIFVANAWNHVRVARQFLSGAIVRCTAWICHPVDYRTTPEYATSARLGVDLVTDVLASVPYHLGWRTDDTGALVPGDLCGFSSAGNGTIASSTALGGWLCMYSLFCTNSVDFTTDSQRTWIKGRLELIADATGINQARVLATFQLRLPSMVIRRDIMGHSAPTAQQIAQWAAVGAKPRDPPTYVPIPSASLPVVNTSPRTLPPCTLDSFGEQLRVLNPIYHRAVMKQEIWERERKHLLVKAADSSVPDAEKAMGDYLTI